MPLPRIAGLLIRRNVVKGLSVMDQREQSRADLSAAIALYRAMEMTFWLPQTEAALAQVDVR